MVETEGNRRLVLLNDTVRRYRRFLYSDTLPFVKAAFNEDLKALKLLDRPFYDSYPQARKIINSGGGSGKEKLGEL